MTRARGRPKKITTEGEPSHLNEDATLAIDDAGVVNITEAGGGEAVAGATGSAPDNPEAAGSEKAAGEGSTDAADPMLMLESQEAISRMQKEKEAAAAEELRTAELIQQLERVKKAAEERLLRQQALEHMAREEAAYKLRVEAAKRQQEALRKQIDILQKAGNPEAEAPHIKGFLEEPSSPSSLIRVTLDQSSPLAAELQEAPSPSRFAAVKLLAYIGTYDPREFFMSYEAVVESVRGGDVVKAKAFVLAAEGIARTWYSRLLPLSIHS